MRHNSVGRRRDDIASRPRDLGWDDSLYRDERTWEERTGTSTVPRQHYGRHDSAGTAPAGGDWSGGGTHRSHGSRAGGSGRAGNRRRKKAKRKVWRWVAAITSLAILGTAGAAFAYYEHLNGNITSSALNLGGSGAAKSKANAAGQTPLNILLLGSDSRSSKANQKLGGAAEDATRKPLADVEMLLHVSADRSNMTVVSIPRDTRVAIPKCTGTDGTKYPSTDTQTINTSLQHGGPGCTVATWEKLTGMHIDHFMMVDFAGVVSMADAVGGVPVCVKSNIYDPKSGLKLTAGNHTIKGVQALQWLRTRHGFEDGSDIGRTHAQHMYMNSMVRELKSSSKLTNVGELTDLAEAATKNLTVDDGLGSVGKLVDLAEDLQKVPTNRITMTTMPWGADPEDPVAHVVPTAAATKLFTLLRNDEPVDGKTSKKKASSSGSSGSSGSSAKASPKSEIAVTVQNGTGSSAQAPVSGRAGAISDRLNTLGYTQAAADTTPESQSGTTLTYPSADQKANAQAVAKSLGLPSSALKQSSSASGITLVVGADWTEGTSYPKGAGAANKEVLNQSSALNASDKSACMKVNPYNVF
jgi:LCP family protein required for cell wall assembly